MTSTQPSRCLRSSLKSEKLFVAFFLFLFVCKESFVAFLFLFVCTGSCLLLFLFVFVCL